MTPKEKATELFNRFKWHEFHDTPLVQDGIIEFLPSSIAKQCALICVEKIDEILVTTSTHKNDPYANLFSLEYWQDVKSELEKL